MLRNEVFEVLSGEREYQIRETADPARTDMVEDFDLPRAMLAMQYNMNKALEVWYRESEADKYQGTLEFLRKVASIVVSQGERYGLPRRKIY